MLRKIKWHTKKYPGIQKLMGYKNIDSCESKLLKKQSLLRNKTTYGP